MAKGWLGIYDLSLMRVARPSRPATAFIASLALLSFLPAASATSSAPAARAAPAGFQRTAYSQPNLTGTYRGHAPAADAAKRVFTLDLAANGSAALTILYIGRDHATERGHWSQNGTQLLLTFDAIGSNAPPRPVTFRYRHNALRPIHWDPSEWGQDGPPVFHRGSYRR